MSLFYSQLGIGHRNTDGLGKSASVIRVDLEDKLQEALLDRSLSLGQRAREILNAVLPVGLGEHLVPEHARLLEVSVRVG